MKQEKKIDDLYKMRHTAAHALAAAVKELYPDVKLGFGPVIDTGFYYDFEFSQELSEKDLPKIEKRMKKILKQSLEMTGEEVSVREAKRQQADQPYKHELIDEYANEGQTLTLYTLGDFTDLCKGGHCDNTKEIDTDAIKLTHLAGAYWRGDEKNKMLTRIYAAAFASPDELDAYLKMLEEAKKRDHRKLGKELDLFTFSHLVGPGLPLFTAKGTILRRELEKLIYELQEPHGYERVWTPHITKPELYKASGHWDKFADDIFHVRGKNGNTFVLKPMNCPHHAQIFKSQHRSYRDLPIRTAEFGTVYRDENAGQLQGLTRVRSISQDDAHVFCAEEHIHDEILHMIDMAEKVYALYGMTLQPLLSVRDPEHAEKYLGKDEQWDAAERELRKVLTEHFNDTYDTDIGGAAFYGPKIDLFATDAIGRKWQLSTFQIDFNQPERLDLTYTDKNNNDVRPFMVHRAILGSLERHLGVIIEHFAGNFPLWLSPVQVALLPVSDAHNDFARDVADEMQDAGLRAEVDDTHESVGKKIRNATTRKIPYAVVLGDKEKESGTLPVRKRGSQETVDMSVEDFIPYCLTIIQQRSIQL